MHFPESDSTPVSMLEGISSGNLIICNEKIDSYKKLAENYKLFLIDLNNLNKDYINKIINENIIKLNKLHEEKITIKNIKALIDN